MGASKKGKVPEFTSFEFLWNVKLISQYHIMHNYFLTVLLKLPFQGNKLLTHLSSLFWKSAWWFLIKPNVLCDVLIIDMNKWKYQSDKVIRPRPCAKVSRVPEFLKIVVCVYDSLWRSYSYFVVCRERRFQLQKSSNFIG